MTTRKPTARFPGEVELPDIRLQAVSMPAGNVRPLPPWKRGLQSEIRFRGSFSLKPPARLH